MRDDLNLLEAGTKSGLGCLSEARPFAGPSEYPASGVLSWCVLCPYLPKLVELESGRGLLNIPFWSSIELCEDGSGLLDVPFWSAVELSEYGTGLLDVLFWSAAELFGLDWSSALGQDWSRMLDSDWLKGPCCDRSIAAKPFDKLDGEVGWLLSLRTRSRWSLYLSTGKKKIFSWFNAS